MRKSLVQKLALACFFVVFAFAALCVRAVVEGESEIAASDAAFDKGDLPAAIEHARRSATAYVPGAPHVGRAYERLRAIALGAEAAGQPAVAFSAWQAVRSAALESRHLSTPRAAELERANQNLARLELLARPVEGETGIRQQKLALGRLSTEPGPQGGWLLLLGASFCLTLAGLGLFAWRGLDVSGRLNGARSLWGLGLVLIGAACWTLAVLRA